MKDLWRMDNERGYWIRVRARDFFDCVILFGHSTPDPIRFDSIRMQCSEKRKRNINDSRKQEIGRAHV